MIDTEKYTGHTSGSKSELHPSGWWVEWVDPCTWYIRDPEVHLVGSEANRLLIQDAPLLLAEVKRLRHLCDTLFIYAHNIETGQSTIEKSNGEPLSTIDFEKDMTWVNWVNRPKISNIKIGGISYLKITDDSIHSDGEADYVLASECKAGHYVGEIGYEDCPDCGGEEE
jgi:hypothetical protein